MVPRALEKPVFLPALEPRVAGNQCVRLVAPVGAAFWLKESASGQRYLYVASDRLDGETIPEAHGEVLRLNKELADPTFDPFQKQPVSF